MSKGASKESFFYQLMFTIVNVSSKEEQEKAWQQLVKEDHSSLDFTHLVCRAPRKYKEKAWQRLLHLTPSISQDKLCYIMRYGTPYWKQKAWQQYLKQNPTPTDNSLYHILQESRYDAVAQFILKETPGCSWNVGCVIEYARSKTLKDQAWSILMKRPDTITIEDIAYNNFIPKYTKAARKYLKAERRLGNFNKFSQERSA